MEWEAGDMDDVTLGSALQVPMIQPAMMAYKTDAQLRQKIYESNKTSAEVECEGGATVPGPSEMRQPALLDSELEATRASMRQAIQASRAYTCTVSFYLYRV